jgi:hypothetical protein
LKKYVYRLEFIAESRSEADQLFHGGQEPFEMKVEEEEFTDEDLEILWEYLGDIPVNNDGLIETPFLKWGVGTDREKIWKWFDRNHSEGVAHLMNLE